MEIRHLVFGRFYHRDRDSDFRVLIRSENIGPEEAKAIGQHFGGLKDLSEAYNSNFPEIIQKFNSYYCYIRFFPSFNDNLNRPVKPIFHAFIFSLNDLIEINYKPWNLRHLFISEFKQDEIIGYDNTVWLSMKATSNTQTIKHLSFNISEYTKVHLADHFPISNQRIWFIWSRNPYELLDKLDPEKKLFLFNKGILLNYSNDLDKSVVSSFKFVFHVTDLLPDVTNIGDEKSQEDILTIKIPSADDNLIVVKPRADFESKEDNIGPLMIITDSASESESDNIRKQENSQIDELKNILQTVDEQNRKYRATIQNLKGKAKLNNGLLALVGFLMLLLGINLGYIIFNGHGTTVNEDVKLKQETFELKNKIEELQSEVANKNELIKGLQKTSTMGKSELQQQYIKLRTESSAEITKLKRDTTNLNIEISGLNDVVKNVSIEKSDLNRQLANIKTEKKQLEANNSKKQKELESEKASVEKELEKCKTSIGVLKDSINVLRTPIVQDNKKNK